MRINPPLPTHTRASATRLRAEMTDAERALWFHLRACRLEGLKFRRQHPVPPYVVDFYCDEAKLVVELDGSQHQASVDAKRTSALERQGLQVLRFWDNQMFTNMEAVLEQILSMAQNRTLSRPTSRAREGGTNYDNSAGARGAPPSPGGRGEKQGCPK